MPELRPDPPGPPHPSVTQAPAGTPAPRRWSPAPPFQRATDRPRRWLLTVSGDVLVAAPGQRRPEDARVDRVLATGRVRPPERPERPEQPGRPDRPGRLARLVTPYARIFTLPGTRAFTVGNLVARLPMGMFTISAVLMIVDAHGSYALAGGVTATGLATTAVVAPLVARLIDRHGQARVALPATLLAVFAALVLVACVRGDAPVWTYFAAYAGTATIPNIGGMSRARWAHLLRDDPDARHTANSFEQAADELCFLLGPVLATFLCVSLFPAAGTLVGAVLLLVGMVLFTAQRRTEPPRQPPGAGGTRTPLRARGMPVVLTTFLATGVIFGSMEVVSIAFLDSQGHRSLAGLILGLQAAGSGLAGLVYGLRRPRGRAPARFAGCVGAMAVLLTLPLAAAGSGHLSLLALSLLVAGVATAPTMVTGMTLVQSLTPSGQQLEGMTLAVTALLGGIAGGAAAGGWAAEHLGGGPASGYAVPLTAATLAAAVTLTGLALRAFGPHQGPRRTPAAPGAEGSDGAPRGHSPQR